MRWLVFCLCLVGFSAVALATDRFNDNTPLVIAYLPPSMQNKLAAPDAQTTDTLEQLGQAVFRTLQCLGRSGINAVQETTFAGTLAISQASDQAVVSHTIILPTTWPETVGLVLVRPGIKPLVVAARGDPSTLKLLGPQKAARYFGALFCSEGG